MSNPTALSLTFQLLRVQVLTPVVVPARAPTSTPWKQTARSCRGTSARERGISACLPAHSQNWIPSTHVTKAATCIYIHYLAEGYHLPADIRKDPARLVRVSLSSHGRHFAWPCPALSCLPSFSVPVAAPPRRRFYYLRAKSLLAPSLPCFSSLPPTPSFRHELRPALRPVYHAISPAACRRRRRRLVRS